MNGRDNQQQQISIAAAPLMINGLKAEFHVAKYAAKRIDCPFDAGFDIYADRSEPKVENHFNQTIITVGTSLMVTPPVGCFGHLCGRSSSEAKLGGARVKPGVIDAGYTGETFVQVVCDGAKAEEVLVAIKSLAIRDIAFAQMILIPCLMPVFQKFDQNIANRMKRGVRGFGSTDKIG